MKLSLLSKYRKQLMGLSMLFILIFHTGIDVENINIIRSLKNISDIGVDMFLLLSGIGLYFSYDKDNDKRQFYTRRVLRILPTFLPVAIVWYISFYIIFGGNISDIVLGITTLGFWIKGTITWWFISAILLLYLVTPFYLDVMKKSPKAITSISCIICIALGLLIRFTNLSESIDYLLIFICRVPCFCIGLYIGLLIKNNIELKHTKTVFLLGIIGFIVSIMVVNPQWIYIPFILKYFAYIPLTLMICLLTVKIFETVPNRKYKLLVFLGTYSLELYLLHEKILWVLSFSERFIVIDKYHIVLNIVAYAIAMVAAYIWSNIVAMSIKKYQISRK